MPEILVIVEIAFANLCILKPVNLSLFTANGATGLWRGVYKSLQDDDKVIKFSLGPLSSSFV